jgi:hypothetical protein
MFNSSRKVDAARNVSAVCLRLYQQEPEWKKALLMAYFVTLFAFTALSALSKVSRPNCSTYAWPAVSSIIVSSVAYRAFVYLKLSAVYLMIKATSEKYLLELIHQRGSVP